MSNPGSFPSFVEGLVEVMELPAQELETLVVQIEQAAGESGSETAWS